MEHAEAIKHAAVLGEAGFRTGLRITATDGRTTWGLHAATDTVHVYADVTSMPQEWQAAILEARATVTVETIDTGKRRNYRELGLLSRERDVLPLNYLRAKAFEAILHVAGIDAYATNLNPEGTRYGLVDVLTEATYATRGAMPEEWQAVIREAESTIDIGRPRYPAPDVVGDGKIQPLQDGRHAIPDQVGSAVTDVMTVPVAERLVAIQRAYAEFKFTGPTAADRERDQVIGFLLDRVSADRPQAPFGATEDAADYPARTMPAMVRAKDVLTNGPLMDTDGLKGAYRELAELLDVILDGAQNRQLKTLEQAAGRLARAHEVAQQMAAVHAAIMDAIGQA